MSDHVTLNAGTGGDSINADDLGADGKAQGVKLILGADNTNDGYVASGNPLPVAGAVTVGGTVTLAALPAGDNNIGNVDVVTLPNVTIGTNAALVAGAAIIGKVGIDQTTDGTTNLVAAKQSGTWNVGTVTAVTAISNALPAGTNNIGDVDIASIAAGDNNIGNVDIVTMPNVVIGSGTVTTVSTVTSVTAIANALPAGNNNIGDVDVASVPTDPFGANADAASATGSISAKLRGIATALGVTAYDLGTGTGGTRTQRVFLDTASTVGLVAGSAAIGKLAANSGVDIGDVDVTTCGTITPGTAATNLGKAEDAQHASGDVGVMALAVQKATPADLGADADYGPLQVSGGAVWTRDANTIVTCTTAVVRPSADATQYAINDALSDSTSGPTAGGFTITSAARVSGGSGIITDMIVTTSADQGTLPQLEVHLFDQAVTNINDNSAFAVSDAEALTYVGTIPATLEDNGNNGYCHVRNLGIGFTCVGSANLRFLVKMKNTYTPVSATPGETFNFRFKIIQSG